MTPTPVPSNQSLQIAQQLIDSYNQTIQKDVLGFMYLMAIGFIILAAAVFIYFWARRNNKPAPPPTDPIAGTNAAIGALAESLTDTNARYDETRDMLREENKANREQYEKITGKYIEALTINSDAMNRLSDKMSGEIESNNSLRASLSNMIENGSKPLQGLITKAISMETDIAGIKSQRKEDHELLNTILSKLEEIQSIAANMVKRDTSENQATVSTEALKTE